MTHSGLLPRHSSSESLEDPDLAHESVWRRLLHAGLQDLTDADAIVTINEPGRSRSTTPHLSPGRAAAPEQHTGGIRSANPPIHDAAMPRNQLRHHTESARLKRSP